MQVVQQACKKNPVMSMWGWLLGSEFQAEALISRHKSLGSNSHPTGNSLEFSQAVVYPSVIDKYQTTKVNS